MHENFEKAQDIFVHYGARISEVLGLSEGMARIVALVYMSPEPLSIPGICKRLDLTKGTVSVYLRMLEERKIIVRSWAKKKGRQKFYEINPSLWEDVINDFRERSKKKMKLTESAVEEAAEAIMQNRQSYDDRELLISRILMQRLERIKELNRVTTKFFSHIHPCDIDNIQPETKLKRIDIDD